MKRVTSKVVSILLIFTLVFTSAGMAFGAEMTGGETAEKKAVGIAETAGALQQVTKAVESAGDLERVQASGSFVVSPLADMTEQAIEALPYTTVAYGAADIVGDGTKIGYKQAHTFANKGLFLISAAAVGYAADGESIASGGSVEIGVYKDAALTQKVDSASMYTSSTDVATGGKFINIPAKGTYHIAVTSPKPTASSSTQSYKANVAMAFVDGGDRTLKNGKWTSAVGVVDTQASYFKFKATKTGYIKVAYDGYYSANMALTNSKKKALSKDTYMYGSYGRASDPGTVVYGVKKGTTYYIRVKAVSTGETYKIKANNSAIKEKSGAKKSKAVTVKKNKTVKGTIIAGSSTADWYKLKLTKNSKLTIVMKGGTNDQMKVTVYKGSKKKGSSTFTQNASSLKLQSINQFGSRTKFDKGTYYIKVQRANKYSSGYYTLKWVTK